MQAHPLCAECLRFQPTLPARGATRRPDSRTPGKAISTHAPRTGSDFLPNQCLRVLPYFNPRSPHGERPYSNFAYARCKNFNPRSPHGERPTQFRIVFAKFDFNPRSPHGERRGGRIPTLYAQSISTHAPRTGSDGFPPARGAAPANFNPRSPHGERRGGKNSPPPQRKFQPTLPARGATTEPRKPSRTTCISTHAPRTGSDAQACAIIILVRDFNPRSPHGERHGGVKEYV